MVTQFIEKHYYRWIGPKSMSHHDVNDTMRQVTDGRILVARSSRHLIDENDPAWDGNWNWHLDTPEVAKCWEEVSSSGFSTISPTRSSIFDRLQNDLNDE